MTEKREKFFHIVGKIIKAYSLLGLQRIMNQTTNALCQSPLFCAFAAKNPLGRDNYVVVAETPKEAALMMLEDLQALSQNRKPPHQGFKTLEEAEQDAKSVTIRTLQTFLALNAENN